MITENREGNKLNDYFCDELSHSIEAGAESLAEGDEIMGEDHGLSFEGEVNVVDIE